jgi:hypothetical protein
MRILFAIFILAACVAAEPPGVAQARKSAERWLPLLDAAKYAESWDGAADWFRKTVTQEQWKDACAQARKPLGKFKSRSFTLSQYTKDLPNAPAGDYYLIQYTSDFENRNAATETVILVRQNENDWRVAGYFIK